MRPRVVIALALIAVGVLMIGFSVTQFFAGSVSLNTTVMSLVGVFSLFIGLVILITTMLESWLSRGQRMLVDGLQAG